MRSSGSSTVLGPLLVAALSCGGATGDDTPPSKDKEPTGASEMPGSSSDGGPIMAQGDRCDDAPEIGAGRYDGSLFNAAADLDGLCGFAGPDVFVRVRADARADLEVAAQGTGFAPRVAILGPSCTEVLACAQGLPATVLDVAAGAELVVAIGVDGDAPAAMTAMTAADLGFRLTIAPRPVIAAGSPCGLPGHGRCESGTACLPDDGGALRCTALEGDTCQSAVPVVLDGGSTSVIIDPAAPQTDAHEHSCTGARRRERVLRVALPEPATLVVSTAAPGVGLAIRGPGCASFEELACAAPTATGAVATAEVTNAFVFVELPADDPAAAEDPGASELGPFEVLFAREP